MTEANVFQLSQPGTFTDPLTAVLRNGARALLAQAVEAEASALLASHADKLTEDPPAAGPSRASGRNQEGCIRGVRCLCRDRGVKYDKASGSRT